MTRGLASKLAASNALITKGKIYSFSACCLYFAVFSLFNQRTFTTVLIFAIHRLVDIKQKAKFVELLLHKLTNDADACKESMLFVIYNNTCLPCFALFLRLAVCFDFD